VNTRTKHVIRYYLLPFLLFLFLGAVFFGKALVRLNTHIPAGMPGTDDAFNQLWTYWWFQKALVLGKKPLKCDWVYPPQGLDLFYHTHVFLPTMLTLPLGRALGAASGYNLTLVLMLAGAAWVFYVFARRGLELSAGWALLLGGEFGYCGYFVFKAHCHPNLIGAVFWASALGILFDSYARRRFGLRRGLLLAVCVWATFWTSLVEAYMLGIVGGALILAWFVADREFLTGTALRKQLRFFAPTLAGGISLLYPLLAHCRADLHSDPLPVELHLSDVLRPHAMGLLSALRGECNTEFSGSSVPVTIVLAAAAGFWLSRKRPAVRVIAAMAVIALCLALNPFGLPLALIHRMPLGSGFRVSGRFFPFFLFWAFALAAVGIRETGRRLPRQTARAVLAAFALASAIESFPVGAHPAPIHRPDIDREMVAGLDRRQRLLLLWRTRRQLNDTYQVFFDMPSLHLSYLARGMEQMERWGATYRVLSLINSPHRADLLEKLRPADLGREMKQLRVGYIFIEEPDLLGQLPIAYEVLARCEHGVLIRYLGTGKEAHQRDKQR